MGRRDIRCKQPQIRWACRSEEEQEEEAEYAIQLFHIASIALSAVALRFVVEYIRSISVWKGFI